MEVHFDKQDLEEYTNLLSNTTFSRLPHPILQTLLDKKDELERNF